MRWIIPQQVGEPADCDTARSDTGCRLVDIPDPNLRALLEETLETKTFRPDVMSTLKILRAKDRNFSDLTGLEFAVTSKNYGLQTILSAGPISHRLPIVPT